MQKLLFFLALALPGFETAAQPAPPLFRAGPRAEFRLAYVGTVIYPGLRAGVGVPIRQVHVSRHEGQKLRRRDRHLVVQLGGYHHATFHDNLYLTAEWQQRRTGPRGWFSEFAPGAGYSRTFLSGTTYDVSEDGTVSIRRAAGYSYALLTIGGGAGYDFSIRHGRPVAAFLRSNLLLLLPYNHFVYARPTVELGLCYQLAPFGWPKVPQPQAINR